MSLLIDHFTRNNARLYPHLAVSNEGRVFLFEQLLPGKRLWLENTIERGHGATISFQTGDLERIRDALDPVQVHPGHGEFPGKKTTLLAE